MNYADSKRLCHLDKVSTIYNANSVHFSSINLVKSTKGSNPIYVLIGLLKVLLFNVLYSINRTR
jgi:hypothetical protein